MRYVFVAVLMCCYFVALPHDASETTPIVLARLATLRGADFLKLRTDVLTRPDLGESIRSIVRTTNDLKLLWLAGALEFRQKHPDEADLLERQLRRSSRSQLAIAYPDSVTGDGTTRCRPFLVAVCFGKEPESIIVESLFFSRVLETPAAVQALIEMRDLRCIEPLLLLTEDDTLQVRASAVYALTQLSEGFSKQVVDLTQPTIFGSQLPAEMQGREVRRELPEFNLDAAQQAVVATRFKVLLESDSEPQVRALAAQGLSRLGETSIATLSKALRTDKSSWVRAICAEGLWQIGDTARLALTDVAATEVDKDVLLVIGNKARPQLPATGKPRNSIINFARTRRLNEESKINR